MLTMTAAQSDTSECLKEQSQFQTRNKLFEDLFLSLLSTSRTLSLDSFMLVTSRSERDGWGGGRGGEGDI